jgi:hypothetical protein
VTPEQVDRRELLTRIELGLDIEKALGGAVARYLCHRAEEHRQAHLEALAELDPTTPDGLAGIRRAQIEIAAIDRWQEWLADAVQEGNHAQDVLVESEQGEPN